MGVLNIAAAFALVNIQSSVHSPAWEALHESRHAADSRFFSGPRREPAALPRYGRRGCAGPVTLAMQTDQSIILNPAALAKPAVVPEWRNRQAGMAYRQLGRTGLMTSEFISGGDPIRTPNYKHLDLALEMGLNYLDMAPASTQKRPRGRAAYLLAFVKNGSHSARRLATDIGPEG